VYITTGAMVPEGAQGVVKIEDTSAVGTMDSNVQVHVKIPNGCNIRQIGSDINKGEIVIKKGTLIGPAEVGLLATVGVMSVLCYTQPVIGILSTGSELVNPWEAPVGSQIRDSNRATLLAAFEIDGYTCIDLGINMDAYACVHMYKYMNMLTGL
jgi:gephyrin